MSFAMLAQQRQPSSQSHQASRPSRSSSSNLPLSHSSIRPSVGSSSATPAGVLSSPSISNNDGFFERESRADSVGTLWSSADVPLILDGHRGSGGESSSVGAMLGMHTRLSATNSGSSSSGGLSMARMQERQAQHSTSTDEWDSNEMLMSDDGQAFTAVRVSPRRSRKNTGTVEQPQQPSKGASLPFGWTMTDAKAIDPDAERLVASLQQPSSRPGSSSGTGSDAIDSTPQKRRPARLQLTANTSSSTQLAQSQLAATPLRRDIGASDVPVSVSTGSHLTLTGPGPRSANSKSKTRKPSTSPAATDRCSPAAGSSELYRYAERFFDSSYSMASPPPSTPAHLCTPEMARLSRFSDDSHLTAADDSALRSQYAHSQNSHSSAESSGPPDIDDALHAQRIASRLSPPGKMDEGRQPMSPLRVAMSLAKPASPQSATPTPSTLNTPSLNARRPSTTDASMSPSKASTLQRPTRIRHAHTSSDQELLRRLKLEGPGAAAGSPAAKVDDKLAFLHAPPANGVTPPSPKRGALFGLRIRAVSTPRLRQSRGASQDGLTTPTAGCVSADKDGRPVSNRSAHPPRAPSGRFRAPTNNAEMEDLERSHSNGSSTVSLVNNLLEETTTSHTRRSSSAEALAAAARRFRRPSRNGSNTSLVAGETRQRAGSNASSQMNAELHHTVSSTSLRASIGGGGRRSKVTTPTSATRPKTKSGWASHLSQGLTLHLEQSNGRKLAWRMNYLYYDPFGRPESLCQEPHGRGSVSGGGGGSVGRNGSFSADGANGEWPESMGVLEFTPDTPASDDGQSSPLQTRLSILASDVEGTSSVVLKHLTIGDDRGDLITRQADLSLAVNGTHEVSGSERKGKVSWRFVFAVEDVRGGGGGKVLRPVRFSCSTSLLDPTRARKSRMFNMIRKQVSNHLETHTFVAPDTDMTVSAASDAYASPQRSPLVASTPIEAPLSPRSLPRSRDGVRERVQRSAMAMPPSSPTQIRVLRAPSSSTGSSAGGALTAMMADDGLLSLRNGSMASVASSSVGSASWSPASRPNLVPFKVKKPLVDALRSSGRISNASEHGGALATSGLPALASTASPMMTASSLASPLTSVEGSPSPGKHLRELYDIGSTYVTRQQHHARHAVGPAPSTALGLETNAPPATHYDGPRQPRAVVVSNDDWGYETSASQWHSSQSRARARRMRTVTDDPQAMATTAPVSASISRPPTASEEIKMAYLNGGDSFGPARGTAVVKQRHGGNGSGHGHSHSVVVQPQSAPAAQVGPIPPRRLTSASINVSRPTSSACPTPSQQHGSPHESPARQKRLPPKPSSALLQSRRPPSAALRASSIGQGSSAFDLPEGSHWV